MERSGGWRAPTPAAQFRLIPPDFCVSAPAQRLPNRTEESLSEVRKCSSPVRRSRWQRSPSSLTACGSPRWSRRWPGVGQSRWPGRPRRWTGSAVAGSPWVWVWAATRFGGELSRTGEEIEGRRRGQMLDQSLDILTAAWSGQPVHHHGPHHTVDGIQFLPRPVQRPGVPVWAAGLAGNVKSLRRAARSASPPS